jgi:hypothetical protein
MRTPGDDGPTTHIPALERRMFDTSPLGFQLMHGAPATRTPRAPLSPILSRATTTAAVMPRTPAMPGAWPSNAALAEAVAPVDAHVRALAQRWRECGHPEGVRLAHPRFVSALQKCYLDRALAAFGHTLPMDEATREPGLLVDGKFVGWRDLDARFEFRSGGIVERETKQVFTYLEDGLTAWDPKQWSVARPMKHLPEGQRPDTPQLVLYSSSNLHAWFELAHSDGRVYSFGMQNERGLEGMQRYFARSTTAQVTCPDAMQHARPPDMRVPLPIDEATFDRLLTRVTKYNELGLHFNWPVDNCNNFANHFASLAGTKIDIQRNLLEIALPESVNSTYSAVPSAVRAAIRAAGTLIGCLGPNLLMNGMLAFLGGFQAVDRTGEVADERPHALLEGSTSLVLKNQALINSPYAFRAWMRGNGAEMLRPPALAHASAQVQEIDDLGVD